MISSDINTLKDTEVRSAQNIGSHLMTTSHYPLLYQQITKCGCTYLRNLIWYLEHGELHPAGDKISTDDLAGLRAFELSDADVRANRHKFVVIRHPAQRFLSLYFDKIIGRRGGRYQKIAQTFIHSAGVNPDAGQDLAVHRNNCHNALDFIGNQLESKSYRDINWHWKPQKVRMSQVRDYDFNTLHLEGLDWQLPQVLGDIVPNIDRAMQTVTSRNASSKPVANDDILDQELRLKINGIYRTDYLMWKEVRNFWAKKQDQ